MIKDTWKPRSLVLPSEWSDGLMDSWVISPQHFPWNYLFSKLASKLTPPKKNHLSQLNPSKKLKIWNLRKKSPSTNLSDHHDSIHHDSWLHPWSIHPPVGQPPNHRTPGGTFFNAFAQTFQDTLSKTMGLMACLKKHVRLSGFNLQYMRLTGQCYMYFALCKYISMLQNHRNIGIAFQALWKWNIPRYYSKLHPVLKFRVAVSFLSVGTSKHRPIGTFRSKHWLASFAQPNPNQKTGTSSQKIFPYKCPQEISNSKTHLAFLPRFF